MDYKKIAKEKMNNDKKKLNTIVGCILGAFFVVAVTVIIIVVATM